MSLVLFLNRAKRRPTLIAMLVAVRA